MKLLEASVKAATDARTAGSEEPVSVTEAKRARASRTTKAKAKSAPSRTAATEDAESEGAKRARRRKSA